MGGPENGSLPLLHVVKCPYVGGWVVQKSHKTPLPNITSTKGISSTKPEMGILIIYFMITNKFQLVWFFKLDSEDIDSFVY